MTEPFPQLLELPHDCLILDACCLIDLYASGCMVEILQSLPCTVAVAQYVVEHEATSLRAIKDSREAASPLLLPESFPLSVVDLNSEVEENTFVDFAAAFGDDGESYTCAIAINRNWAIATTDRKVITLLQSDFSHITVVKTPDLIKHWADATPADAAVVRQAVRKIQEEARYRPHRNHPLSAWWQAQIEP